MNYLNHYNKLIERAKNRNIHEGYYESHHIIPRCMGGNDDSNNIVKLTPEEHYVAHQLLYKIYKLNSLIYACMMMSNGLSNRNNKCYGWIRKKHALSISKSIKSHWLKKYGFDSHEHMANTFWPLYINENLSINEISKLYNVSSGNVYHKILLYAKINDCENLLDKKRFDNRSKASKRNRANFTSEQEAYRIERCKAYDYSKNNQKLSLERKGTGNPMFGKKYVPKQVTCPHCNKIGGDNVMKKWHFDRCKYKEKEIYEN